VRILPFLAILASATVLFGAVACGDDDSTKTTPTAAATAVASATTAVSSPSAATATKAPATTTAVATAEGTVDPLGSGQQTPWTVKGNESLTGNVTVTALRSGLHPEQGGWERLVFEFAGNDQPPATIQYVTKATQCGSGQAVTTTGSDILEVAMTHAQAHDDSGKATLPQTMPSPGGTAITGGVSSCDFEGHVTWDFGMNGKHNFKVTTLTSPTRLVIDVKQ
jgi:hypothetical protein